MSFAENIAWAALNSIWQSGALAVVVFMSLRLARRTPAAGRYACWAAVLVACAVLPFANLALPARTITYTAPATTASKSSEQRISTARTSETRVSVAPKADVLATTPQVSNPRFTFPIPPWPLVALLAWASVMAFAVGRLLLGYLRLRHIRATLVDRPLSVTEFAALAAMTNRPIRVGYSAAVGAPCVIGFAEPTIVLPTAIAERVTDTDLLRILRHECAHVARHDDYGNFVEQLIRALYVFNPVVYFVARALDIDREVACDDAVALQEAERVEFAKCLYEMALRNTTRSWIPATGFVRHRSHIALRVSQLLDRNHNSSTHLSFATKTAFIAIVAAIAPLGYMQLRAEAACTRPHTSASSIVATQTGASTLPTIESIFRVSAAPSIAVPVAKARPQAAKTKTVTAPAVIARPAPNPAPHVAVAPPHAAVSSVAHATVATTTRSVAANDNNNSDDFIDALAQAGYRNLSVHDLIAMRNAGVTPEFVRALQSAGGAPLSVHDVIRAANAGVNPEYITNMRGNGYTHVSIEDLIRLRNAGVDDSFVDGFLRHGYRNLSVEDLIRLRNAGVDADYVDHLSRSGLYNGRSLSVEELIKLRNAGV